MTAPAPPAVALAPFFASAFVWNLALGMSHVLIPLYAYHLGYSGVAIGTLVSAPVVAQLAFNLVGGVWTDRIGGKRHDAQPEPDDCPQRLDGLKYDAEADAD